MPAAKPQEGCSTHRLAPSLQAGKCTSKLYQCHTGQLRRFWGVQQWSSITVLAETNPKFWKCRAVSAGSGHHSSLLSHTGNLQNRSESLNNFSLIKYK